jgi:hypothetical protein
MEYYVGPWDSPVTKNGIGIVFEDALGMSYNSMPITAGTYDKPLESFTITDLPDAMGYLETLLATVEPSEANSYQLIYKADAETPFISMLSSKWQDSLALPTTSIAAKSRLPSPVWKGKSVSTKY